MRMGVVAAVMSLAVAVGGCSALGVGSGQLLVEGFVLFESYRLETEWGYKLEGIYIDSEGLVWRYRHDQPWYPKEQKATVVKEADLLKKYDGAKRVGSIDPRVLEEMSGLVSGASKARVSRGTPSLERNGSLDVAYTFVPRTGSYNTVFLTGSGDWAARNASSEARELVEWLAEVKKAVGYEE